MLPTIFTTFLYGFLYHFPLVSCISCIFNIFFQEFYPSPSVSDRFCTISSGCYRIFLHFHCIFPTCLLHHHSLFLAVAPVFLHVPTDFAPFILVVITFSCQVVITFSCTVSFQHFPVDSARFPLIVIHVFLQFLYPLRGFSVYSCIFNLFFQDFYPSPFCTISSGLLHFSMYFAKSFTRLLSFSDRFLHHFLWLLSHFPALSLSFSNMFYCIVIVCS